MMLHDVAAGMSYLHARNHIHGDLRSPNLFVGTDGKVREKTVALRGYEVPSNKARGAFPPLPSPPLPLPPSPPLTLPPSPPLTPPHPAFPPLPSSPPSPFSLVHKCLSAFKAARRQAVSKGTSALVAAVCCPF